MAHSSTEAHHGSVRSDNPDSDTVQPAIVDKGNTAGLPEAQNQARANSGTVPASNVQLHLPTSSTSMLTQWVYETHESKLTWTEKWHRK